MLFRLKNIWRVTFLVMVVFTLQSRADSLGEIRTDQARYSPGDSVNFNLEITELPGNSILKIEYLFLNRVVDSVSYYPGNAGNFEWVWQTPNDDFRGYLVVISLMQDAVISDRTVIGVDVSSDWSRFPRYGFLSAYPYLSQAGVDATIAELNRYHINGIQYYDWHYKHHLPLKGTPENPAGTWPDIANRTNYFATIKRYIDTGHLHGMKAMAYNLLYGAYEDAQNDGVQDEWRLFKDTFHSDPDFHDLPDTWASDIYLIDPSNPAWKNYIFDKMSDVFEALPFDGWHIDQLGDRGARYNYSGQRVDLNQTFLPYIEQTKDAMDVSLVMNAVNQYGQQDIAKSPVDFLYTEVWWPNETYSDLVFIILDNASYSENKLSTVLAAYMDRSLSSQSGYFNAPGVFLTDAVIFAAGGSHLELGEHMLANEYFPNNNLQMSEDLKNQLVHYYDFLVAYQNLLRDGGDFNQVYLTSENDISIKYYAQKGSVWNFSKLKGDLQIFHLINFKDATSLNWRDDTGTQPEPETISNTPVYFTTQEKVKSLWLATPDFNGGNPENLLFSQKNDTVYFEIPYLKYWDMLVAEYDVNTGIDDGDLIYPGQARMLGNYPNPFNPETRISFELNASMHIELSVYNIAGQKIATLANQKFTSGQHSVSWKPESSLASAVYFAVLKTNEGNVLFHKLLYLK
ncbi:MAG: glycoside hydrolase family 66 protein [Calditrichaceae bacterium]